MKIVLLGSQGRQGKALQKALDRLEGIGDRIALLDRSRGCEQNDLERAVSSDCDLVISCLPYECNIFYGEICIKAGNRWADLGSHVQSNRFLTQLAFSKQVVVATDLGLAPGLIEYLGFKSLKDIHSPRTMTILCGGLPKKAYSRFGYQIVFSPAGLVNNYIDNCEALHDGHICNIEPMGDNRTIYYDGVELETGNSSGGATWKFLKKMKELGLENCRYQTLRHPGHWEMVQEAWDRYSDAPDDVEARADMVNWIVRHAESKKLSDDVVFLGVEVNESLVYTARIEPDDGFSAMQRATAFPTACASVLLAQGEFDKCNGPVNAVDIARSTKFWDMLKTILPEIK